jgi:hypothetical protein
MADEDPDPFAAPPVSLPTEEELRARIEALAGRRYSKQRRQLYADLAELNADARQLVLRAVLREYQLQRRPPGRRQRACR